MGKIMRRAKYGHLMLPGVFLDKIIHDIEFTEKTVDQCDVPVAKILLEIMMICK